MPSGSAHDADVDVELRHASLTIVLWDALKADRRARDACTARLRAMRLIDGDEDDLRSVFARFGVGQA